jgi:hypothetical protein
MRGYAIERHHSPLHGIAIVRAGAAQMRLAWGAERLAKIATTTAAACRAKEPEADLHRRHLLEDNPASG